MSIDLSSIQSQTKSAFVSECVASGHPNEALINALWDRKRGKATSFVRFNGEEAIGGVDLDLTTEDIIAAEDLTIFAKDKEPYGDVRYADPGYQKDGKKRYPIDTPEHIRAAWSYINQGKNSGQYSSSQVSKIKARIVSAWKSKIDKAGPPSAKG